MNVVLAQAYPSRIAAIESIMAHPTYAGGAELRARAEEVASASELFGKAATAKEWQSFSAALEILSLLADWSEAVHTAAIDADRFLRAARLRYRNFAGDAAHTDYGLALAAALASLDGDLEVDAIPSLRDAIAGLAMPVGIFGIQDRSYYGSRVGEDTTVKPEDIAVAFLEFAIDGKAAETFHSLRAGRSTISI